MEVRYMNKSRSLIDIFIIYAIEILCNIKVDITVNINIKIVLDIAVISISYNFFYRTNLLYINLHIFYNTITTFLQKYYSIIYHTLSFSSFSLLFLFFLVFSSSFLLFALSLEIMILSIITI